MIATLASWRSRVQIPARPPPKKSKKPSLSLLIFYLFLQVSRILIDACRFLKFWIFLNSMPFSVTSTISKPPSLMPNFSRCSLGIVICPFLVTLTIFSIDMSHEEMRRISLKLYVQNGILLKRVVVKNT